MAEYIEREALKNNLHFTKEGIFYHNGKAYMDLNIVDKIVLETSTDDVVSVVRCRDCVYCYPVGENTCFCRNIDTPWFNSDFEVYMNAKDYCSYGERRVEEGE